MTDELTIALVGCGNIARAHWNGIQRRATMIKVTACVDSVYEQAAAMAKQTGSVAFDSLDEALTHGQFDAVDLMLPHNLHEEACMKCFRAGKHVVLEKPIAHTLESAERIVQAAKDLNVKWMVAEQAQYWSHVVKIRELIDQGFIGDVVTANAYFFDRLRIDPANPIPWRYRIAQAGGGISMDGGAHWIRPMRMMLGEIDEVFAATAALVSNMEGESLAHAVFRFESGVIASFQAILSGASTGPINDFRVTGTEGELISERGRNGRLMAYTQAHPDGREMMSAVSGKVESFGVELADFANYILNDGQLAAGPEYALGELRTALAMYRSVNSGTWEKVWD